MTKTFRVALIGGLMAVACAAGCHHYKITDPSTDKTYFTKSYKEKSGAVKFSDARSGADVNIQNAEIIEISGSEYRDAVKN
ncbi:MAG: hypothetical protein ACO3YY_04395 [Phycisphaerales bacterium]|jgi:hypothetical protein|nr:hypothetical protein [Planctomycetota bacterium]